MKIRWEVTFDGQEAREITTDSIEKLKIAFKHIGIHLPIGEIKKYKDARKLNTLYPTRFTWDLGHQHLIRCVFKPEYGFNEDEIEDSQTEEPENKDSSSDDSSDDSDTNEDKGTNQHDNEPKPHSSPPNEDDEPKESGNGKNEQTRKQHPAITCLTIPGGMERDSDSDASSEDEVQPKYAKINIKKDFGIVRPRNMEQAIRLRQRFTGEALPKTKQNTMASLPPKRNENEPPYPDGYDINYGLIGIDNYATKTRAADDVSHQARQTADTPYTFDIGITRHYGENQKKNHACPNQIEWTKITQNPILRTAEVKTKEKLLLHVTPDGSEEDNGVSAVHLATAPFNKWNKIVLSNKKGVVATLWACDTKTRWEKYMQTHYCQKPCCLDQNSRKQRKQIHRNEDRIRLNRRWGGDILRYPQSSPVIPEWFFDEEAEQSMMTWVVPAEDLNDAIIRGMDESSNECCPDFISSEGQYSRIVPQQTVEKTFINHWAKSIESSIKWETTIHDKPSNNISVLGHGFRIELKQPNTIFEDEDINEANSICTIKRIYSKDKEWDQILIENKQGPVAVLSVINSHLLEHGVAGYRKINKSHIYRPTNPKDILEKDLGVAIQQSEALVEQIKNMHSFFRVLFPSHKPYIGQVNAIRRIHGLVESIGRDFNRFENIYWRNYCKHLDGTKIHFRSEIRKLLTSEPDQDESNSQKYEEDKEILEWKLRHGLGRKSLLTLGIQDPSSPSEDNFESQWTSQLSNSETFTTGMVAGALVGRILEYIFS
jgi:hypothetical protein